MKSVTREKTKCLNTRLFGRFYTHELIGHQLANQVADALGKTKKRCIKVVEPFCGDGRLIVYLLEASANKLSGRKVEWEIELWDNDETALKLAEKSITSKAKELNFRVKLNIYHGNSFEKALRSYSCFDVCITNPPWETLKPDARELKHLSKSESDQYIEELRRQDAFLAKGYPLSRPAKKFSGWGTNLSRCGAEAALNLVNANGICAQVLPASILGDQSSEKIREFLFGEFTVSQVSFFAAETKLFEKVDQPSIFIVAQRGGTTCGAPTITSHSKDLKESKIILSKEEWTAISSQQFRLPIHFGLQITGIINRLNYLPKFSDLEGASNDDLWAGRELDETGHQEFPTSKEKNHLPFIKGRMIERFGTPSSPTRFVPREKVPKVPPSVKYSRLVWRDVARPNQKRRVHATIISPGWIAGNSLHVAHFRDDDAMKLKILLAIINSLVFEAQVRQFLATGHISLGAVRQARIPEFPRGSEAKNLVSLVDQALQKTSSNSSQIEVAIARLYGLSKDEFELVINSFEKLTDDERSELLNPKLWSTDANSKTLQMSDAKEQIPNHYAPSLSELDLEIARAVPPGGNWKDIPESVPSQRIANIRLSYARGEGSRSTYYGRLSPNAPAYTINTYFSRPGNGCHLHYDYEGGQHRTLSQREAARLQSFPDSFKFLGSNTNINTQIGNAVPPLLAFQIAKSFQIKKAMFVDLFSGAGGLGLGFRWANWLPVIANDVEAQFLKSYAHNVHPNFIAGDIRDKKVFDALLSAAKEARAANSNLPLFVVGGPPCQGFSTAGNRRSMSDDRNWLFLEYKKFLDKLKPDGFVFENVSGLINMEKGKVFELVTDELRKSSKKLHSWVLKTEEFAIPQRRTRVILIGDSTGQLLGREPTKVTRMESDQRSLFTDLCPAITVKEALCDLPKLVAGQDGKNLSYLTEPQSAYQRFMRGVITPAEYLQEVTNRLSLKAA